MADPIFEECTIEDGLEVVHEIYAEMERQKREHDKQATEEIEAVELLLHPGG